MFGCSEHEHHRRVDDALTEHLATPARLDRLSRTDTLDGDAVMGAWESRRISRRALLVSTGAMALAATAPSPLVLPAAASDSEEDQVGRRITIESIAAGPSPTVRLGQFRMDLPDIATVESGDVIRFPNTLTHFLGALQPGLTIQQIAQLRLDNPGKGPHSIIGPIGVRDAHPGDVLEVRFRRLDPIDFGANFHNPLLLNPDGTPRLRTGVLAEEFPNGQVIYFDLDNGRRRTQFRPGVHIPLAPFQGTFGLAPPGTSPVVSSVPPGQHAGNVDLREMVVGSRLFIPVWRDGARIFTGDSHVAQGDGEVNLTAIESAMRDLEVQIVLHEGALTAVAEADRWPMVETETHWIAVATAPPRTDTDPRQLTAFGNAFIRALRNVINFLSSRAGLTPDDAYALSSIAVSFRFTQAVDTTLGVHGMIPKGLFDEELREAIRIA